MEYARARAAIGSRATVIRAGIAMDRGNERINGVAISCGLAGGLRRDLATGTVVIPERVVSPDGTIRVCDATLSARLRDAAKNLGMRVCDGDIFTSDAIVHGSQREELARRGYAAVDMESAFINADALACVRVILDTPLREISPAWVRGARVVFVPSAWRDLPFLMQNGPRCARAAADVVAEVL